LGRIEAKRTIKGPLNAGIDYAANNIKGVNGKIEYLFGSLQCDIAELTGAVSMKSHEGKLQSSIGNEYKQMNDF
jgi:hypothetical protein